MTIHKIYDWRLILESAAVWTASEYLLRNLRDYPRYGGGNNPSLAHDQTQTENFLTAYSILVRSKENWHESPGFVPVIAGDLDIPSWRSVLAKRSVVDCSEIILSSLFDPTCDFNFGQLMLSRALTAYAENALADHGLGIRTDDKLPALLDGLKGKQRP